MIYKVYRQRSRPFPQIDGWEYICRTESENAPEDYDWNQVVRALTDETVWEQSAKGIWWMVVKE